ncbi:hypothetical protein Dimus_007705 [Dionaea muscipula]
MTHGTEDWLGVFPERCARKKKLGLFLPRSLLEKMKRATAEDGEFRVKENGISPIEEEGTSVEENRPMLSSTSDGELAQSKTPLDDDGVREVADDGNRDVLPQPFSTVSPFPSPLSGGEDVNVDGGMVSEEVKDSPTAREAVRPQPTDGLRRHPLSPVKPWSAQEVVRKPNGQTSGGSGHMSDGGELLEGDCEQELSLPERMVSFVPGLVPIAEADCYNDGEDSGRAHHLLSTAMVAAAATTEKAEEAGVAHIGCCCVEEVPGGGGSLPTGHVGGSVVQEVYGGVQTSRTYAHVMHSDRRADVELSSFPLADGENSVTMEESHGDTERTKNHACISSRIIGWHSTVGQWARVENMTVLGEDVHVGDEIYSNGGVVLPHKEIKSSILKPEIVM